MSNSITVNLRAVGTDPANPTAGKLVGSFLLLDADTVPPLIRTPINVNPHSDTQAKRGRLFRFAPVSFFGPQPPLEYVEVEPVDITGDVSWT